ncbi:MAG: hypothetical protein HGA33_03495, partial [Candidatus Moranbacteria bacterium]|nr:hypothetical protein [Candidatus Moranbacteria bacterium]
MPEQFLLPFLISFSVSVVMLSVVPMLSRRFASGRNEGDRVHKRVPRLGGAAL